MSEIADTFDSAFTKAVDLGNRLADRDKDADLWDIADGLQSRAMATPWQAGAALNMGPLLTGAALIALQASDCEA